ncbi:MAG: STAS domain-containing protein [Nocardioides sp.]
MLVHLAGELDTENASRFVEAVTRSLAAHAGREVEVDLSGLTFLDVAGVRALATVHDRATRQGARMRVRGLDATRLPAAAVLGLDQYLRARPARRDESAGPNPPA